MIRNIDILKSYVTKNRGEQLRIKLAEIYCRHAFDTTSSLKQKLQESLDIELNFKCEVSDILIDNNSTVGIMNFTISYNKNDE